MKKVAYYKGCLASLSAKELDSATQALAPKVGLELDRARVGHVLRRRRHPRGGARLLPAPERAHPRVRRGGGRRHAAHGLQRLHAQPPPGELHAASATPTLRARVNENLVSVGVPAYERDVDVRHLLWEIAEGEGYELLKQSAHRGLKGLKIAPFYGCQILRPSKILGFEDPDRPWSLERIIEACGGEADRLSGEDQVLRLPDHPGARGDGARRADPADRAGVRGRRRRDRDAVPALPPLARRVAVEAEGGDGPRLRDADPPPLAARRRRRRPRGVGAEVQAARRLGRAGPREAPDLTAAVSGRRRARGARDRVRRCSKRAGCGCACSSCRCDGLPPELDGLRIAHLSDFHLGVPSRGAARRRARGRLGGRAQAGSRLRHRRPRSRGRAARRSSCMLLARLPDPYVVLGNHDFAISRDPFSKPVDLSGSATGRCSRTPRSSSSARPAGRARRRRPAVPGCASGQAASPTRTPTCGSCSATSRARSTRCPGRWHLILAGHLHAGQIVLPYGFGKLLLAHPRATYVQGVYRRDGTTMHVSPGLGTTFVPFRFFARPEATELVLRCG